MSFLVHHRIFLASQKSAKKVRKFAKNIASQQNSGNQYCGVNLLVFLVFGVLIGVLGVLVGVLGVLVGVFGVLVGVLGVLVDVFVFWLVYLVF